MNSYSLNIADYTLTFKSAHPGLSLQPSSRFVNFLTECENPDIVIDVHVGECIEAKNSEQVFGAPLFEEKNGIPIKTNDKFWSVTRLPGYIFMKTAMPYVPSVNEAVLTIPDGSSSWSIWISNEIDPIDPMAYPLDGLLLYYLTVIHNDIMIHASGIQYNNNNLVFSGVSGQGKSTMSRLWANSGAEVIHDDRLIIRNKNDGFWMHNTPIYDNDIPKKALITELFLISHGESNSLTPIKGSEAITSVLSNCIQHTWDKQMVLNTLKTVSDFVSEVPIAKLSFIPDTGIVDYLLKKKEDNKDIYSISLNMLSAGKSVKVKAYGYSMYPTIKPGSTLTIDPLTTVPKIGELIAIKADKRFIVHRLIDSVQINGETFFKTRGDSNRYLDNPISFEYIAGRIRGYETPGNISRSRYCFNFISAKTIILLQKIKRRLPFYHAIY